MEKIWEGQHQGEQVVGPVVRKGLWTLASATLFLGHARHTGFSFPPKYSSWGTSHTRMLFPLPDLAFCASLLGSFLLILNFYIKCQSSWDTFPDSYLHMIERSLCHMISIFFSLLLVIIYLLNIFLPTRAPRANSGPAVFAPQFSAPTIVLGTQ